MVQQSGVPVTLTRAGDLDDPVAGVASPRAES
jgi:hypothetical protein